MNLKKKINNHLKSQKFRKLNPYKIYPAISDIKGKQ